MAGAADFGFMFIVAIPTIINLAEAFMLYTKKPP